LICDSLRDAVQSVHRYGTRTVLFVQYCTFDTKYSRLDCTVTYCTYCSTVLQQVQCFPSNRHTPILFGRNDLRRPTLIKGSFSLCSNYRPIIGKNERKMHLFVGSQDDFRPRLSSFFLMSVFHSILIGHFRSTITWNIDRRRR